MVFSIGLLGVAGLLLGASRANHQGYLRTQVTYLAQNMANRMSANPVAVWEGDYDSSGYPLSTSKDCSLGCIPSELAVHDQGVWSAQLRSFLPASSASINCVNSNNGYNPVSAGKVGMRPPYSGTCKMKITWASKSITGDQPSAQPEDEQTFAWVFQP